MAYTLNLTIYSFTIHRITGSRERRNRNGDGGMVTIYDSEDNDTMFSDIVLQDGIATTRGNLLERIFTKLLNFYDNRFRISNDGSKAVSITNQLHSCFGSTSYTISGMFKGGDTGIDKIIYKQNNAIFVENQIRRDDVPANNYYYKIWLPYDYSTGILMIQSYTDSGCTNTFKEQIDSFFISLGYKAKWNRMIPSGVINSYLNRSFIKKIEVTYVSQPRQVSGVFRSMQHVKRHAYLSNINIPLQELFQIRNYRDELKAQIQSVIPYNEEHDSAKVFYVDERGKKAHASISNMDQILPNIVLPDTLLDPNTKEPIFDEINTYTDNILRQIKEQLDYSPIQIM